MGVPASRHGKITPRNKIPGAPTGSGLTGVGKGGRTFVGSRGSRPAGSDTSETASAPIWVAGGIPDQNDAAADQPLSLIVAQYMEKSSQVTTFTMTAPAGFYMTTAGKITVFGAAPGAHSVTVHAHNPHGTTDDTFTWTLT